MEAQSKERVLRILMGLLLMHNMEKLRHSTIKGLVAEDGRTIIGVADPQIEASETIYTTSYWAKPNSYAELGTICLEDKREK